ncbi:MAG: flagellum-specific ATP synthase FliI, partial [Planctomycetes bacterium]|nr:flagellum-specific ATP synthase FliI [Planctomycetota bacterium]
MGMTTAPDNLFLRKQAELPHILGAVVTAKVNRVAGLTVECSGMPVPVGSFCTIFPRLSEHAVEAEVVGFKNDTTYLMPLGEMQGVGPGDRVECFSIEQAVPVGDHLLGRVLDGRGRPADGKGPIHSTNLRRI